MVQTVAHLKVIRQNLLDAISELSPNEVKCIPEGFNNSILWNSCHMLVTQQVLVYRLSGNDSSIPQVFIERYRKGTKPMPDVDATEDLSYLKANFLSAADQMVNDYEEGLFKVYQEYTTSFGVTLKSVEDAILFNNLHESMHLGYVLSMKHLLR
jgi:hypothetical protein